MKLMELIRDPVWQIAGLIIFLVALTFSIYFKMKRVGSIFIVILAILSVILILFAVVATVFLADLLASATATSGRVVTTISGVIAGIMVNLLVIYLYNRREMRKKRSVMTRLRQKEKDLFSRVESPRLAEGESR